MTRNDPPALHWLVGAELTHFRKQAGLTIAQAAGKSGIGRPKLGHMETGKYTQYPDDVANLMTVYGAPQRDVDRMASLAGSCSGRSWLAPWKHLVPDWFKTFVGLEGLAESEFVFEPMVLPGLLQTEEYAQAITDATGFVRRDQTERFVSFRLTRAKRLTDDVPLNLHVVVGEGALRLDVGTPDVREAQLRHVLTLAKLPTVTIQVIRPEDGPHAAMTGRIVVLDFAQAQSIAYSEQVDGAVYVQDQDDVRTYKMAVENLKSVALTPAKSLAWIRSVIDWH
ncbi:helix-turn-helix domain-containing protein [Kibdelosporangium phytohabitans]|uniref:XRE family transcriptional regulator n=1 Tax=Kibdelosporangium phytohabitans TaxID=860235 RepID=A0A0N9I9Q6_9PSEU|nr:helix-turn-helix transcriptional regulator [Kibdelosporangium phytohabitans]ALG13123.1 XRE family transcriptional regulator [Kibdelosporangium phytohabitans]MBE1464867.1 transcriptional regulator with XRE-family HTH domain [Kibdelosporangium phytohabitans]